MSWSSFGHGLKLAVVVGFKGLKAVNGMTIGNHKILIKELPGIEKAVEAIAHAVSSDP